MKPETKFIHDSIADIDNSAEGVGVELRLSFAKIINRKRLALGWTQEQLAQKAGVKGPFVSRVLHGENATLDTIANLLHALGLRGRLEEVARVTIPIEKTAFFQVAPEDFKYGKKIKYKKSAIRARVATLRSIGQVR